MNKRESLGGNMETSLMLVILRVETVCCDLMNYIGQISDTLITFRVYYDCKKNTISIVSFCGFQEYY